MTPRRAALGVALTLAFWAVAMAADPSGYWAGIALAAGLWATLLAVSVRWWG
jgi:hypothetical protein